MSVCIGYIFMVSSVFFNLAFFTVWCSIKKVLNVYILLHKYLMTVFSGL